MHRLTLKARFILFLLPLLTFPASIAGKDCMTESAASITITHVAATPGEGVNVPVTANGLQNIGTLQLWIDFNGDVLEFEVLHNIHPLFSAGSFMYNLSEGVIKLSWYNDMPEGITIPPGDKLFDMRFTFCADALACALNDNASPIFIVNDYSFSTDPSYNAIPLTYYDGSVYSTVIKRALSVSWDGNGMVTVDGSAYTGPLVVADGAVLSLDAVATGGWTLLGWSGALSGATTPQTLLMDNNKEVMATFEMSDGNVPDTYHVNNVTVEAGESACYNALETITVAGDGATFTVSPGGSALLIAGKNIVFLPGARVEPGGYLLATISEAFCDAQPDPGKSMAEATFTSHEEEKKAQNHHDDEYRKNHATALRVYPNPTRGIITVELTGEAGLPAISGAPGSGNPVHNVSGPGSLWGGSCAPACSDSDGIVHIEIYNLLGNRVINTVMPPEPRTQIDLTGQPPGIYIVRALQGNATAEIRLIKTY